MRADAPSCGCGDPGDLAASAHPRGSLQASGAGTVPGAPHSAPHLRATPSSCGTVAGPASLPPGAVPASPVSAQGGVLRGESRLPLRAARLPRPARSEVAAFGSSRRGARASLPTLVGACESASGKAGGGGGGIGELPPLLALDPSYPAVFGVRKWEVCPFAWRTLGRRNSLGSADAVRWAGGTCREVRALALDGMHGKGCL